MFETFVSSKTRRLLFEYLLTHPDHRFYLRGLSRELDVATSPLRRELKRLQQLGVLRAYEEANALFYIIDRTSPLFAQLQSAMAMGGTNLHGSAVLPSPASADSHTDQRAEMTQAGQPATIPSTERPPAWPVSRRSDESAESLCFRHSAGTLMVPASQEAHQSGLRLQASEGQSNQVEPRSRIPRGLKKSSWRWPVMIGGMSLGMLVTVVIGGIIYLAATNQRLLLITSKAIATPRSQVTVVESVEPKPTREMRGSRWHMTPGAVGGFSQGVSDGSY